MFILVGGGGLIGVDGVWGDMLGVDDGGGDDGIGDSAGKHK